MLFGHQNDDGTTAAATPPPLGDVPAPPTTAPATTEPTPALLAPTETITPEKEAVSALDQLIASSSAVPSDATTAFTPDPVSDDTPPPSEPVSTNTSSSDVTTSAPTVADSVAPATTIASDDLLSLKQAALTQLSPLVGQLDQTPEEKFRTTMMMIQSTDNSSLLKEAYDAAQQIPDEKARAQALLDVVNEINYFTQKPAA